MKTLLLLAAIAATTFPATAQKKVGGIITISLPRLEEGAEYREIWITAEGLRHHYPEKMSDHSWNIVSSCITGGISGKHTHNGVTNCFSSLWEVE